MPTPTYDLIASNVLSSSASSVTFSSIPATYGDLVLVCNEASGNAVNLYAEFNGDTGANYSYVFMRGDGSSTFSGSGTGNEAIISVGSTAQLFIMQIMDYSATDKHKTYLSRSNRAAGNVAAQAGRWANTAAINSIRIFNGSIASGTTFYLYGIAS